MNVDDAVGAGTENVRVGGLATALAGDAIGSVIVLTVGLLVRFESVPREVAANDRLAAERDADLEQWVADESVVLEARLREVRSSLHRRGALSSGDYRARSG